MSVTASNNGDDGDNATGKLQPVLLFCSCLLIFAFGGLGNGGPFMQERLVSDRHLTWREAESVFDNSFVLLNIGAFLIAVWDPTPSVGIAGGLVTLSLGFLGLAVAQTVTTMSVGFGLVAIGGTCAYITALGICAAMKSPVAVALLGAAYNMSGCTLLLLRLPIRLDVFCCIEAAAALTSAFVAYHAYRKSSAPPAEGSSGRTTAANEEGVEEVRPSDGACRLNARGFRELRYWLFCLVFVSGASGLTWGTGTYDGAVDAAFGHSRHAEGKRLSGLYPVVVNASFIVAPAVGWVSGRIGFILPSVFVVAVAQSFLACFAWSSTVSLHLVLPLGNLLTASVWTLQSAYLLTFNKSDYMPLLAGTILLQAIVFTFVDIIRMPRGDMAKIGICILCLSYSLPILHIWRWLKSGRRQVQSAPIAAIDATRPLTQTLPSHVSMQGNT